MFLNGFIFLDRKFLTWRWYNDPDVKSLFLHLLLTANFEDTEFENIELKRGQVKTTISELCFYLKQTPAQIRANKTKLESTGEIASKTTNKYSIITIVKYDIYQTKNNENNKQNDKQNSSQNNKQDSKQTTNKQQTNNKQPIYNVLKEGEEVKKEKENKNKSRERVYFDEKNFKFPEYLKTETKALLVTYIKEVREQKWKLNSTDLAIKILMNKLENYSNKRDDVAQAIISEAYAGEWQSFHISDDTKKVLNAEAPTPTQSMKKAPDYKTPFKTINEVFEHIFTWIEDGYNAEGIVNYINENNKDWLNSEKNIYDISNWAEKLKSHYRIIEQPKETNWRIAKV